MYVTLGSWVGHSPSLGLFPSSKKEEIGFELFSNSRVLHAFHWRDQLVRNCQSADAARRPHLVHSLAICSLKLRSVLRGLRWVGLAAGKAQMKANMLGQESRDGMVALAATRFCSVCLHF